MAEPLFDRVHHIGMVVSDLDRTLEFYGDLFDVTPLFVNDMRGRSVGRGMGIEDPDLRFSLVRIENVILEFIEWRRPEAPALDAKPPYLNQTHIAFEVDDVAAVHAKLRDKGIETVSEPHPFAPEDEAPAMVGATFVYFTDPDGMGLEVFQKRSRHNDY